MSIGKKQLKFFWSHDIASVNKEANKWLSDLGEETIPDFDGMKFSSTATKYAHNDTVYNHVLIIPYSLRFD